MNLTYDEALSNFAFNVNQRRYKAGATFITSEMGEDMRRRIGAAAYVECSALTQDNLGKVFETAIDVHMRPPEEAPPPPPPPGCWPCCFGGGAGGKRGAGAGGIGGGKGVTNGGNKKPPPLAIPEEGRPRANSV